MSCGDGIIKASLALSKPLEPDVPVLLAVDEPDDEDELPDS